MKPGLSEQIRCIEREIKMRQRVYTGLVDRGKMTLETSVREISAMGAVLETLKYAEVLAKCLDEAPRWSDGVVHTLKPLPPDVPEGACSVMISATLASQIALQLRGEA